MAIDVSEHYFLQRIIDKGYNSDIFCAKIINGSCDTNWNKEYEFFYSRQPNSLPHVQRLMFRFKGKKGKTAKAGFVNIRSVSDAYEVTETYLVPPKNLCTPNAFIKCLSPHKAYGETVECVPFVMPESVFGMCIHASIWICLKILQNQGMVTEALTIPEIQLLASGRQYNDKQGLPFVQASRLLRMCRIFAFYVNNEEEELSDEQMVMQLYAYVESKLPVILGVDVANLNWWHTTKHSYHSIVGIGHTMTGNKVDGFIIHDESSLPYQTMTEHELLQAWHKPPLRKNSKPIRELLVAVPPEVSIPFHKVYHGFHETLRTLRDSYGLIEGDVESYQARPMLIEPSQLFYETRSICLLRALREAGMPKYVWAVYFFPEGESSQNWIGFYARDTTEKSSFVFAYIRDKRTAMYQIEGKTYQRWDDKQNRKRIM
ncbi:MAG: hypothetical protein ABSF65_02170 [Candidatus Bathyarchaeia archaeon]